MSVAVRVDADTGSLHAGEKRYPIRLDLDAGTATVTFAWGEVTLRQLRWREKMTLARFAPLGARFMEREFMRACVRGEAEDERDRDMIREVALWWNAPHACDAVPFDAHVLVRAMVDVCRETGLRPGDLDTRSALEVETLWRTLASNTSSPERPVPGEAVDEGWTRISVVPDPISTERVEAETLNAEDASAVSVIAYESKPSSASLEHVDLEKSRSAPTVFDAVKQYRVTSRLERETDIGLSTARDHREIPARPLSGTLHLEPTDRTVHASPVDPPASVISEPLPMFASAVSSTLSASPSQSMPAPTRFEMRRFGVTEGERGGHPSVVAAPENERLDANPLKPLPPMDIEALIAMLNERFEEAAAEIGIAPWE